MTRIVLLLFLATLFAPSVGEQKKAKPAGVIFDTDIGPDYDDVGAITMLHAFADSDYISILATMASNKYEGIAAVLNVFNTYFGRPGIPIGVPKGNAVDVRDFQHWTDTVIANYTHKIKSNAEAADVVTLYRKILSKQPDHSVTIITVGFLTNVSNLLLSNPDEYSDMDGSTLVAKKVKQLVSMAGKFPGNDGFTEFNLMKDIPASKNVFENWPTEIIYSGFEIGAKIKTGLPLVQNNKINNSPVKDVFRICLPMAKEDNNGRMSWDETAVLVAVKGALPWFKLVAGKITVNDNGSDSWNSNQQGQYYLAEQLTPKATEDYINHLIQHQPVKK